MVNLEIITAALAGFLAGIATHHVLTAAKKAWQDAQAAAEAKIGTMRFDA